MQADRVHVEQLRIAATHPALPGHFPGAPLVPGVVLLARVAAAIECAWGLRVMSLVQVKFLRPLAPEHDAQLQLQRDAERVRFDIRCGDALVAHGIIEVAA
jgi:3-hydroxymyristoyl/3-hydroxydecanoyl-(acyl carrier protein) dehydratase